MNHLIEEDLDINGEPEIILLENLTRSQWSDILPQVQYRIKLNAENHQAIAESGTAQIPVVEQEQLSDITLDSQELILRDFGNKLYRQGRYEAAIKHYQRLLVSQTGDIELYGNLSKCLRNLHRIEEAIAILD